MQRRSWLPFWASAGVLLAGIAFGLLLERWLRPKLPNYGFPPHVLPSFAERLSMLFQRMKMRGYDPALVDPAPQDGRAFTLEDYGAAAHIVSQSRGTADPGFFEALGRESSELGLTWGGTWSGSLREPTLIQAIPYFLASEFLALETNGAREQFLRETYSA